MITAAHKKLITQRGEAWFKLNHSELWEELHITGKKTAPIPQKDKYIDLIYERKNDGKDYKEYLKLDLHHKM